MFFVGSGTGCPYILTLISFSALKLPGDWPAPFLNYPKVYVFRFKFEWKKMKISFQRTLTATSTGSIRFLFLFWNIGWDKKKKRKREKKIMFLSFIFFISFQIWICKPELLGGIEMARVDCTLARPMNDSVANSEEQEYMEVSSSVS